jgi:transposase-like protein
MGIFTKGINKGAYRGELTCPYLNDATMTVCGSKAIRLVEEVTPYRLRYRCRKCGRTFQYDISNAVGNPYMPTRKEIVGFDLGSPNQRRIIK